MKALKTWKTDDNTYIMAKNEPFGVKIDKFDKAGNLVDSVIGATEYSLEYWFEHKNERIANKNF